MSKSNLVEPIIEESWTQKNQDDLIQNLQKAINDKLEEAKKWQIILPDKFFSDESTIISQTAMEEMNKDILELMKTKEPEELNEEVRKHSEKVIQNFKKLIDARLTKFYKEEIQKLNQDQKIEYIQKLVDAGLVKLDFLFSKDLGLDQKSTDKLIVNLFDAQKITIKIELNTQNIFGKHDNLTEENAKEILKTLLVAGKIDLGSLFAEKGNLSNRLSLQEIKEVATMATKPGGVYAESLHWHAIAGNDGAISKLSEQANKEDVPEGGHTPMFYAEKMENGKFSKALKNPMLESLKKEALEANSLEFLFKQNPALMSAEIKIIANHLLDKKPNNFIATILAGKDIGSFLKNNYLINKPDEFGKYPLEYALDMNEIMMMEHDNQVDEYNESVEGLKKLGVAGNLVASVTLKNPRDFLDSAAVSGLLAKGAYASGSYLLKKPEPVRNIQNLAVFLYTLTNSPTDSEIKDVGQFARDILRSDKSKPRTIVLDTKKFTAAKIEEINQYVFNAFESQVLAFLASDKVPEEYNLSSSATALAAQYLLKGDDKSLQSFQNLLDKGFLPQDKEGVDRPVLLACAEKYGKKELVEGMIAKAEIEKMEGLIIQKISSPVVEFSPEEQQFFDKYMENFQNMDSEKQDQFLKKNPVFGIVQDSMPLQSEISTIVSAFERKSGLIKNGDTAIENAKSLSDAEKAKAKVGLRVFVAELSFEEAHNGKKLSPDDQVRIKKINILKIVAKCLLANGGLVALKQLELVNEALPKVVDGNASVSDMKFVSNLPLYKALDKILVLPKETEIPSQTGLNSPNPMFGKPSGTIGKSSTESLMGPEQKKKESNAIIPH